MIVLTYNRRDEVLVTLGLLCQQSLPDTSIIVVDNASTDGTREMVQNRFPNVRVLSLPKNVGVSGWDYGILNTESEYVLLLDDDCAPDPGAIELMLQRFRADPGLAVLAFNIYGGAFSTEHWAS